ncbi:unnamed protein product [Chironomus riparius]|uniref:Nucleolar protein 12 n=1 Tax=Chironomus riparius TaxID=315576 RepID=A0A9N9WS38_9DIPT|nr:unnamed protein product [Chironomus riparius]
MGKSKNKKLKNEIVFDNKEREEFLKGFSKRKKLRQKKAKEEIEIKLKEERKRIKDESKNLKDTFKQSFKPIEELEGVVIQEVEDVTIHISKPKEDKKFIGLKKFKESDDENNSDESEKAQDDNKISGMEVEDKTAKSGDNERELPKHLKDIKSEKDFKKLIKKQTKTALKKSKIIQKKNQLNSKRNVKLSNRKKHFKEKFLKKHKKIPKHNNKTK